MDRNDRDHAAIASLLEKQSLLSQVKKDLDGPVDAIDPESMSRMVDKLYALDGRIKPAVDADQVNALAAAIRRRAGKPVHHFPRKTTHFVRFVSAACAVLVIFFFVNYGVARITGACLLKKVDINFCCHTLYCSDTEDADHSEHS